jgi:hypothetical protein
MEYYRAPFCEPEGGGQYKPENLGNYNDFNETGFKTMRIII